MKRFLFAALLFPSVALAAPASAETRSLIVAGGCFWCVESDFDKMPGVIATTSGYAGGEMENPTYRSHGEHREVVKVDYDDTQTDYRTLIANFLRTIDPTDAGGQFCDRGRSYTSAIHAADAEQMRIAEEEIASAGQEIGREIVTPVEPYPDFWRAEDYHQDYYLSDARQITRFGILTRAKAYKRYREACGRDARVRKIWRGQAYRGVENAGS